MSAPQIKDQLSLIKVIKSQQKNQISSLLNKSEKDSQNLESVRTFLSKLVELETGFAKEVTKLTNTALKKLNKDDPNDAFMDCFIDFISVFKSAASNRIESNIKALSVISEMKDYIKHKQAVAKRHYDYAVKYQSQLHATYEELSDTTKSYQKASKEAEKDYKNYTDKRDKKSMFASFGDLEKLEAKSTSSQKRLVDVRNAQIISLAGANAQQQCYYEKDLNNLIVLIDHKIYSTVQRNFQSILKTERKDAQLFIESIDSLNDSLDKISPKFQTTLFLESKPYFLYPPKFVLEDHGGKNTIELNNVSTVVLGQRLSNLQERIMELDQTIQKKNNEIKGLSSLANTLESNPSFGDDARSLDALLDAQNSLSLIMLSREKTIARIKILLDAGVVAVSAAQSKQNTIYKVEALYDYDKSADNELDLVKGAVYDVLEQEQDGWIKLFNGRDEGYVPANYTELIDQPRARERETDDEEMILKAVYDYNASDSTEISLVAGDLVRVDTVGPAISSEWWEGTNLSTGKSGSFPLAFTSGWDVSLSRKGSVMDFSMSRRSTADRCDSIKKQVIQEEEEEEDVVKALYAYEATAKDELDLVVGDIITVTRKDTGNEAWWEGRSSRGFGQFPWNHTVARDEEYCIAIYDYNAANADELELREGDLIRIVSIDKDWWTGSMNGSTGLFPANYVERI